MPGSFKFRTYEAFVRLLPGAVAARLDLLLAPSRRRSWGGPLNGQVKRAEMVRQILGYGGFQAIVETGTFCGTTTEYLRETSNLPVYSVEINPRFFHYSRLRLRGRPGITLELGDSRAALWKWAQDSHFPHDRVLFYLDAHWEEELPL